MNPTEPNPADSSNDPSSDFASNLSNDLGAIATDLTPKPERSPQDLGTFIDRLYGTLFLPRETFAQIKANPNPTQGMILIAGVNLLEALRLNQGSFGMILGAVISGLIGWLFFTFLLKQLAEVFQKKVDFNALLTLTGFASLPWIFMAPALSLPAGFRVLGAIAVMIWFVIWQVRSASVALDIKSWKTLAIIPLAISGGVVALIWLGNVFKLILSVSY